jgi:hypothetical protein
MSLKEQTKAQDEEKDAVSKAEAMFCSMLHRALLQSFEGLYTLQMTNNYARNNARGIATTISGVKGYELEPPDGSLTCEAVLRNTPNCKSETITSNEKKRDQAFSKRKLALYRWFVSIALLSPSCSYVLFCSASELFVSTTP